MVTYVYCSFLAIAEFNCDYSVITVFVPTDLALFFLQKSVTARLGIDDIILILRQNRLRWYGHVLRKEDTDWVKKCMEYEVEGSRPRGRPKRTWKEVVQKDCQARNLNREDAVDRSRWKKLIKIG